MNAPMMGYRQVRVPAGAHITVHYTVWDEDWAEHLHQLRGRTDHGPVLEEVDPSERIARYRTGFTSYVAHCLSPAAVETPDEAPTPRRNAPERLGRGA